MRQTVDRGTLAFPGAALVFREDSKNTLIGITDPKRHLDMGNCFYIFSCSGDSSGPFRDGII